MQPSESWVWLHSYRGKDGGGGGHLVRVLGEGRDLLEHQDRPRGRDLERADGRWGGEVELQHEGGACQVDNEYFFHLLIFIWFTKLTTFFLFAHFLFFVRLTARMERKVSCLNARLDKQVLFNERSGNIDQVVRDGNLRYYWPGCQSAGRPRCSTEARRLPLGRGHRSEQEQQPVVDDCSWPPSSRKPSTSSLPQCWCGRREVVITMKTVKLATAMGSNFFQHKALLIYTVISVNMPTPWM